MFVIETGGLHALSFDISMLSSNSKTGQNHIARFCEFQAISSILQVL